MCPSERRRAAAVLLVWTAWAAACAPPAPPPREIVVGVSLPLSGADAASGAAMRDGYARAVDEVNAAGGLQLAATGTRVPVRVLVRDDRAETPLVEEHAAALVKGGAHVLLATYTDVRAGAQAVVADGLGCPLVANPTDAAGLPGKRMSWVFSVPAEGADLRARAHATARIALATVARASVIDPPHLRVAFNGM